MERIRNCRIILLFIFLLGISLFTTADLAYCSTKELIEFLNTTYEKLKKESPEVAIEKEVGNLKVIARENVTDTRNTEKLKSKEDTLERNTLEIRNIAADTKDNNAHITDLKLLKETITPVSSSGGSNTPAPATPAAEVN